MNSGTYKCSKPSKCIINPNLQPAHDLLTFCIHCSTHTLHKFEKSIVNLCHYKTAQTNRTHYIIFKIELKCIVKGEVFFA